MNIFLRAGIFYLLLYSLNVYAQDPSTWKIIQDKILDNNCITCHHYGNPFADQSGLILTPELSYTQLIDVQPANNAARDDSLKRISSEGGVAALNKSFLWEKINAPNQEHFYNDHPLYGSIMPLGLPPLTNGEIQFIMNWILAGAPETGAVVDENLLNDTTRYVPVEFKPLDLPGKGIQLHVGPFDVRPEQINDREFFYYQPLNNANDLYVNRVEISMRPGSHHFLMSTFSDDIPAQLMPQPGIFRDVRDENGNYDLVVMSQMFYHRVFSGTQTPYLNYHFPPGVAIRLPAGKGLDLNVHYVNRSEEIIQGELYANLYAVEKGQVIREAEILFLSNFDINLPPNSTTSVMKEYIIDSTINIFQLWSHSHEHTIEFRAEKIDAFGEEKLIYFSNDWAHPPVLRLDPPVVINAGEKIRVTTTYLNATNETIRFGLRSSDEMQILAGMYYTGMPLTGLEDEAFPSRFLLKQNYPNPFNPSTTIQFEIGSEQHVTLKIYDVLGKEIKELVNERKNAGQHTINFSASDLPLTSGIYYYRISAGSSTETKKMILLK